MGSARIELDADRRIRQIPPNKMNTYSIILDLHVITAILGLGPLAAVTILTGAGSSPQPLALRRIMRLVIWSLAVMLVTGAALVGMAHGALGNAWWWLRISIILFLLAGFLHSRVNRLLKNAGAAIEAVPMGRIHRNLRVMCVCVAAIAYLMQAKPW